MPSKRRVSNHFYWLVSGGNTYGFKSSESEFRSDYVADLWRPEVEVTKASPFGRDVPQMTLDN